VKGDSLRATKVALVLPSKVEDLWWLDLHKESLAQGVPGEEG
jgi:hypothetical protein